MNRLSRCRIGICNTEIERQHSKQHQNSANKGVEKELDSGVLSPWAAPESDQKIHGQQHGFPENEEKKEIESHKHTHHSRNQKQIECKIAFYHFIDIPRRDDTDKTNKRS